MIRYLIQIVLEFVWADWQHVGLFETKIREVSRYPDDYLVIIHCYESRWGTRHAKVFVQRRSHLDILNSLYARRVRRSKFYQTEILPWLRGRLHDKVPAYQQVASNRWDFLKKLKGETPVHLNDDEE